MTDVIVIGSGPAGLSAAINVRQRGGTVLVAGLPIQANPLYKAERVDNYLGLPAMSGKDMLETFYAHALRMEVSFVWERVLNAMNTGQSWMISAGSDVYESRALVFAGGINRGKKYPGEEEYLGRGVSYCATCDGMLYRGKPVVVIGFSETDREEAAYLKSIGCEVTYFEKPRQVEIKGSQKVTAAVVDSQEIETACIFILRPSLAPSSLFPGLELEGNFIRVNRDMETSLPGLFAAGDCTGTPLQVSRAVGDGLVAGQKAMAYAKERNE